MLLFCEPKQKYICKKAKKLELTLRFKILYIGKNDISKQKLFFNDKNKSNPIISLKNFFLDIGTI